MSEDKVALPYGLERIRLRKRSSGSDQNTTLYLQYRPMSPDEFYGPSAKFMDEFSHLLYMDRQELRAYRKAQRAGEADAEYASLLQHAFLLTGDPGCGKTSSVLAIAKMLNCTSPVEENERIIPCNECEACKSIDRNGMLKNRTPYIVYEDTSRAKKDDNVKTMDNYMTGTGNMGALATLLVFEEAQEMTAASKQALLTSLETMSHKHFMFMLSSEPDHFNTEKLKALTQRLRRHHIRAWRPDEVLEVLKDVAAQEEIVYGRPHIPVEVLEQISNNCDNSPRLAITSLLEQVYQPMAMEKDVQIDVEALYKREMPKVVPPRLIGEFATKVVNGNVQDTMSLLYKDILPIMYTDTRSVDSSAVKKFVASVAFRMRDSFKRTVMSGKLKDEELLLVSRAVKTFSETFYAQVILSSQDALVAATMEALSYGKGFQNAYKLRGA
jgi:DNA polymerase III delta prime subunit